MAEHIEPLWFLGIPATFIVWFAIYGFFIDGWIGAAVEAGWVTGILIIPVCVVFFLWMAGVIDG